ncbi:Uncharacterised protein [Segatella copri]|nr:Uncharacterised protein [Segatella copri]
MVCSLGLDCKSQVLACRNNLVQIINFIVLPSVELRNTRLDSIILVEYYIVIIRSRIV